MHKIDGRAYNKGRPKGSGGNKRTPEHMKNIVLAVGVHPMLIMLIDAECKRLLVSRSEVIRRIINKHFGIGGDIPL